tara:strand:- start:82 stop:387 length:306 start_codon:yes stop_codon:yes gene_type:complete
MKGQKELEEWAATYGDDKEDIRASMYDADLMIEFAKYYHNEQLNLSGVSKRCLADIEIEYKHPTGKKKGKLIYDDDEYQTLMLKYDGGFINLPNIEDCNVC